MVHGLGSNKLLRFLSDNFKKYLFYSIFDVNLKKYTLKSTEPAWFALLIDTAKKNLIKLFSCQKRTYIQDILCSGHACMALIQTDKRNHLVLALYKMSRSLKMRI